MNKQYFDLLSKMVEIRTVEQLIADDFIESKIFSFLHLSIGQEASAVGVGFATQRQDVLFGNHRSHAHYLARGGDFRKMILEVYGQEGGCCGGYGGSMHMLDRSVGFVGSTPILGSVAPIGVGLAYSQKKKGADGVAVVFIGDGAAEEGAFYESINLAGLMRCPLIFALEDNRYAVNSRHEDRKALGYSLKGIVEGLGGHYLRVDGTSVIEVLEGTKEIREKVVRDQKPAVFHIDTLRDWGHSGPVKEGDAAYRAGDDTKYRQENDCLRKLKQLMVDSGIVASVVEEHVAKIEKKTTEEFWSIRKTFEVRK